MPHWCNSCSICDLRCGRGEVIARSVNGDVVVVMLLVVLFRDWRCGCVAAFDRLVICDVAVAGVHGLMNLKCGYGELSVCFRYC